MTLPTSPTRHVFQRLGRQLGGVHRSGSGLEAALGTFRHERQNALIEVEAPGGLIGHLLLQNGRLVHARSGEDRDDAALAATRARAEQSRLRLLPLDDDQAALACAAVDGTPRPTSALHGVSYDELLEALAHQDFTGVAALEYGRQFVALRFRHGQLGDLRAAPEVPRVVRLTQIAWQERDLPELRGSGPWAPVPTTPAPATPAPVVEADPTRVWALFLEVMVAQLGDRAPRVVAATRESFTYTPSGDRLSTQLARQVERVAGGAAARDFLARCAPGTPPHAVPR